ncbi:hypothetical protein [Dinoroseobacter sp. S375]|uniref:hypothetical protein n=1 Tax=Dinoroseobacter sp. S375 TaxID=3415136 RepID=UPI003C7DD015
MTKIPSCLPLALALTIGGAAGAAPVIYQDRATFVQETGPQFSVDFNDQAPNQAFGDSSLSVGKLTFSGPDVPNLPGAYNRTEPGPDFSGFHLDGTTFILGAATLDDPMRVTFDTPVLAWGAEFNDLGDNNRDVALNVYDVSDTLIASFGISDAPDHVTQFIGWDFAGDQASYLEIAFLGGLTNFEGFGIDNVLFSIPRGDDVPAPVPLPAPVLLLGASGLALAALRRRRKPVAA